jgi:uncharacterized membrane protein
MRTSICPKASITFAAAALTLESGLLVWVVALVAYIGYNAFNAVLVTDAVHQLAGRDLASHATIIIGFGLLTAVLLVGMLAAFRRRGFL